MQISGPGWIQSERYDISAKTAGSASNEQLKLMLQALLASRFKLALHREKKELPVYALVVGKHGSKLQAAKADGESNLQPVDAGPGFEMASGALVFQKENCRAPG